MSGAAAEFSAAIKQMVAPDEAAADRLVAAAAHYNAWLDDAMEWCFAEGYKAGRAGKGDMQPVVNISPGAISLALPDAVRVQLEPSRTEALVQRDKDGNLTGIRTVST
jgi:hypothetical protein